MMARNASGRWAMTPYWPMAFRIIGDANTNIARGADILAGRHTFSGRKHCPGGHPTGAYDADVEAHGGLKNTLIPNLTSPRNRGKSTTRLQCLLTEAQTLNTTMTWMRIPQTMNLP
jgi:hypothetical protein